MLYKNIDEMINALKFEGYQNYMGRQFFGTFSLIGKNRDSEYLSQSNYECILNELEKLGEEEKDFIIEASSHWACGWVEIIHIPIDAKKEILDFCLKTLNDLDDYPIFDESHFYELEHEEVKKYAESEASYFISKLGDISDELKQGIESLFYYGFEASSHDYGADQAFFDIENSEDIERTIIYMQDNRLLEAHILETIEFLKNK